jgi:hypothetical protein
MDITSRHVCPLQVLAVGVDLFFRRVMPSLTFDQMSPDFNYALLVLMLGGVFVAAFVLGSMVKRKQLESAWR